MPISAHFFYKKKLIKKLKQGLKCVSLCHKIVSVITKTKACYLCKNFIVCNFLLPFLLSGSLN